MSTHRHSSLSSFWVAPFCQSWLFPLLYSPPSDCGELRVHPEEFVIPSGCRDISQPTRGLWGAGWPLMWHWWEGRGKFRMLGQKEEEKEGTWPGQTLHSLLLGVMSQGEICWPKNNRDKNTIFTYSWLPVMNGWLGKVCLCISSEFKIIGLSNRIMLLYFDSYPTPRMEISNKSSFVEERARERDFGAILSGAPSSCMLIISNQRHILAEWQTSFPLAEHRQWRAHHIRCVNRQLVLISRPFHFKQRQNETLKR